MKKIMLVILLFPTFLMASQSVDFQVNLVGIVGEIDRYPFVFDLGLYLPEQDTLHAQFANRQKISLTEGEIDRLNANHSLPISHLKMDIRYNVIVPANPYFKPYPGFESLRYFEKSTYTINIDGQSMCLDEFYISVQSESDEWGASTFSYGLVMDLMKSMVQDNKVSEKMFNLEDEGVVYHFSLKRISESATVCMDGEDCKAN